ncbi:MAG: hypothetical protein K6T16_01365 [Candidatus Pacearchaeota archaeon]|nr:hypothetical protein [Candidatus Pacearchaeota archaeon]
MIEILKRNDKEKIKEIVSKNFGFKLDIPFHLIKQAKDKVRIYTGNLGANDLVTLDRILTIDSIGLYFAFSKVNEFRLSFDASILYGRDSREFIELTEKEAKEWLSGRDIDKKTGKKGYFLIKYMQDILGCGKATNEKLLNFLPKERRIPLQ